MQSVDESANEMPDISTVSGEEIAKDSDENNENETLDKETETNCTNDTDYPSSVICFFFASFC